MEKDHREMCLYCGKWFPANDMVFMREKGKTRISHYCMGCFPEVKSNINTLPWKENYTFYRH